MAGIQTTNEREKTGIQTAFLDTESDFQRLDQRVWDYFVCRFRVFYHDRIGGLNKLDRGSPVQLINSLG
jgi:hypothetical protein